MYQYTTCLDQAQQDPGSFQVDVEDLTSEEQQAFQNLVASGDISHLVAPWQPWWVLPEAADLQLGPTGQKLVAEVDDATATGDGTSTSIQGCSAERQTSVDARPFHIAPADASTTFPSPPAQPLPPLSSLIKTQPSPLLKYQLVELLFAYCFVLRHFNGDPASSEVEAAEQLLHMAAAVLLQQTQQHVHSQLQQEHQPEPQQPEQQQEQQQQRPQVQELSTAAASASQQALDVRLVLMDCLLRSSGPPHGEPSWRLLAVGVLGDVALLLQLGRAAVVLALTDLQRILEQGVAALKTNRTLSNGSSTVGSAVPMAVNMPMRQQRHAGGAQPNNNEGAKALMRSLKAADRKLLFFSAWANEQPPQVFEMLAVAVTAEWQQHQAAVKPGQAGQPGQHGQPAMLGQINEVNSVGQTAASKRHSVHDPCRVVAAKPLGEHSQQSAHNATASLELGTHDAQQCTQQAVTTGTATLDLYELD